jgi:probable HAF family extracellular repeat protein
MGEASCRSCKTLERENTMNAMASLLTRLLLFALAVPLSLAAPEQRQPPRYAVTIVDSLGGDFSETVGINNHGSASGNSFLPGDVVRHGFFWREGVTTDLGTLGGPNSFAPEEWSPNERDEVAGFSDTAMLDPNAENFCGFLGFYTSPYICRPFVWRHGVLTELPTLGGNNAAAVAINNRGELTGVSEITDPASGCSPISLSQLFQLFAVTWRPAKGEIKKLPPLLGDTLSNAAGINDSGMVVGTSGNCILGPIEAVLWRDGTPIDLGTLGGAVFNIAFGINNRGQVVGQSDLPGHVAHHAFLWEHGVMTDLGTLPGIASSLASSINNQGQVVGFSDDGNGNTVALLWQNGTMTDLNTLIPSGFPWFLAEALGINDLGQIVGFAFNATTGEGRGFILTPVQSSESNAQTARSTGSKELPVLPEKVRQMLKRRTDA